MSEDRNVNLTTGVLRRNARTTLITMAAKQVGFQMGVLAEGERQPPFRPAVPDELGHHIPRT